MYNLCNPFSPRQSYAVHLSLWTQLCCFITHIIMATQSNAGYYADRKQPERCQTDDRWPQLVDAVAGMLQEDDLRVEMNLTKIEVWTEGREGGGGSPGDSPGDFPGDFPGESPIFMCPGLTVGRLWVMRLQGPRQGRPVACVWLWGRPYNSHCTCRQDHCYF